jgi:hypothetical protein
VFESGRGYDGVAELWDIHDIVAENNHDGGAK